MYQLVNAQLEAALGFNPFIVSYRFPLSFLIVFLYRFIATPLSRFIARPVTLLHNLIAKEETLDFHNFERRTKMGRQQRHQES